MWIVVVASAVVLALLAGCLSVELGIVAALCAAVWCVLNHHASCKADAPPPPASTQQRSASTRAARVASNVPNRQHQPNARRRRPVVREPIVQRVPLAALLPEHPAENVLDACMLAEQQRRSQRLDAHVYHSQALPNAIRAAARELTTADPAIVPLDGPETCTRPLGHV